MSKKTLVLGSSPSPERYAYKAVSMLKSHGHEVVPIGIKKGEIEGLSIVPLDKADTTSTDTVSLYLNPEMQKGYYDAILKLKPKRIIFNPGTENPDFEAMALKEGIEVEEACTLVLLSTGQY